MLTDDELKSFIPQLIPFKKLRTHLLATIDQVLIAPDVMTFGEGNIEIIYLLCPFTVHMAMDMFVCSMLCWMIK